MLKKNELNIVWIPIIISVNAIMDSPLKGSTLKPLPIQEMTKYRAYKKPVSNTPSPIITPFSKESFFMIRWVILSGLKMPELTPYNLANSARKSI